jgi:SGNH domain (fused to AT3 domains)
MLSLKPMVFVGLISYSAYLWHWPLLVFTRYLILRELLLWEKAVLILLSLVVASMSWAYVERPFRTLGRVPGRSLFRLAGAALGIFVVVSAVGEFSRGLPHRFDPAIRNLVAATERLPAPCDTPESVNSNRLCRVGAQDIEPATFLIWGDSHAGSMSPAIVEIMQHEMLSGQIAVRGRCAPLLGVMMLSGATARACRQFNEEVIKIATRTNIQLVFLHAQWAAYAEGTNFSVDDGAASIFLKDDSSHKSDRRQNIAVFSRGLERTVAALADAGKNIVLVASVPEMKFSIPHALARKHVFNLDVSIRMDLPDYFQRQMNVLNEITRLQRPYGAKIIYPHQMLCAKGYCEAMRDGVAYYGDTQHLTEAGAKLLTPLFANTSQSGRHLRPN